MRVLLTGLNFHPELTGVGKFTGETADWLARDHEVRTVAAVPYYPSWRAAEGYSPRKFHLESGRSGRVWRCPLWIPREPSTSNRLLHLASFAATSLPVLFGEAVAWRPDVILMVAPTLFAAPGVLATASLVGAKTWLHVQDLELDAALGLKMFRTRSRTLESIESRLINQFDRVSTISDGMAERLRRKGVRKVDLFLNWTDVDTIRPDEAAGRRFRREFQIDDDAQVAMYSGSMGAKQGLDVVIRAASLLRAESEICFVVCGDGPAKSTLQGMACGLPNVRFLPLQPEHRLNDLLNAASVHLLPQRADVADMVMPSKLMSILASGRPVIATARVETAIGRLLAEAGGELSPPDDPVALAEAILRLARDSQARVEIGRRARAYAEANLAKRGILTRFEEMLTQPTTLTPNSNH